MNDITPPQPAPSVAPPPPAPSQAPGPVPLNTPITNVGKPIRRHRWLKLLGAVLLVATLVGGAYYYMINSRPKVIKIGDVTITQQDINEYAAAIELYKANSPEINFGGEPKTVALDDLVLNASFKQEAKKINDPVVDKAVADASYKSYETSANIKKLLKTRQENDAYKEALSGKLLSKKDLFYVTVSFDTPFYINKSKEDVAKLRKQSVETLNSKFLPAFKAKNTREEIAKLADVNTLDTDKTDDKDFQRYYNGLVSRANYGVGNTPGPPGTSRPVGTFGFNDSEREIYYGVKVDNLRKTDDEIVKLKKVGDYSGVFASRAGVYTIMRLEGTSGGAYASWSDFLDQYKAKYILAKKVQLATQTLTSKIKLAAVEVNKVAFANFQPAVALAAEGCSTEHRFAFALGSYDTTTRADISGTGFRYSRASAPSCDAGYAIGQGTFTATTPAIIPDNCWNPEVTWSGPISHPDPSKYTYIGFTGFPDWAPDTINTVGVPMVVFYYSQKPPPPPPPSGSISCTLSASPSSLPAAGGTTTLTATPKGGAVVFGLEGIEISSGPWTRSITLTTTFTAIVAKGSQRATCSTTVRVGTTPPPPPPPPPSLSCDIFTGGASVRGGDSYEISWTVRTPGVTGSLQGTDETGKVVYSNDSVDLGPWTNGVGYQSTLGFTASPPPPNFMQYTLSLKKGGESAGSCSARINIYSINPQCVATVGYNITGPNSALVRLAFRNGNKQLSYPDNKLLYKVTWPPASGKASPPGEADGGLYGTKNFLTGAPTSILPPGGNGETAFYLAVPYNELSYLGSLYPDPTFTFRVEKANLDGTDLVCPEVPAAEAYGPWLQSKRGNVMALGNKGIRGQEAGKSGSRPASAADKEAQYVVMGYVVDKFCSTKGYVFGGGCSPITGYKANIDPAVFGNASIDPVIKGINKAITTSISSAAPCTAKQPYLKVDYSTIAAGLGATTDTCQVIIQPATVSPTLTISGTTFDRGSGTLYVKGDVTISGNIEASYTYTTGYTSPKQISNLGIIATGNITIAPGVERIDASLYAAGRVITCDGYPSRSCGDNPLKIRGKLAAGSGFKLGRNYFQSNTGPSAIPAELVVNSGLIDAFPPPGFADLFSASARSMRVLSTDSNPRF